MRRATTPAQQAPRAVHRASQVASAPRAVTSVVVVSIDALNPAAIRKLGRRGTPMLHRLVRRGASTMNARTERELTVTLPNHTGMVTGRRIVADRGGHGITWNDDRHHPATVQEAAGHDVSSVFDVVHGAGGHTAVFAGKAKFSLFDRSWGDAIDRSTVIERDRKLTRAVRRDITHGTRAFRFVHLASVDHAGHRHGFMSARYLRAVRATDRRLGRSITAIDSGPDAGSTVLIVTADHGGKGVDHFDPTRLANYRVPFIVWGTGVRRGADLYALNPDYRDPGRRRTSYAARRQPVRNGDVANLVTDLLGLEPVGGSQLDAQQDLDVR
jgi:predicted AlkP superfamily pyrophosphatase or phosphodiesterase